MSCAASVITTLPTPKPATNPFRLNPKSVIIINPATMYTNALIDFNINFSIESSTSGFILSFSLFTILLFVVRLFAIPFAANMINDILNNWSTQLFIHAPVFSGCLINNNAKYRPSII